MFRLSDPSARGRVRRYAFIAWAGREERRAARAYKDVVQVFAGMAGRIVDLVERRQAASTIITTTTTNTPTTNTPTTTTTTTSSSTASSSSSSTTCTVQPGLSVASSSTTGVIDTGTSSNHHHNNHHHHDEGGGGGGGSRESTPVSSFLSGRSIDPDGHARRFEVRAKGLAELVGKDDVFVEMHAAFVHLLAQLGRHGHWGHSGHR